MRCGIPHSDGCRREPDRPRTIAEQLDDAQTGEAWGRVIMGLFAAMDKARFEEEDQ
jgi:hypothetical protein